jgi:hypothetical protein
MRASPNNAIKKESGYALFFYKKADAQKAAA